MKRLLVQIARIDLNYKQDNLPALSLSVTEFLRNKRPHTFLRISIS